MDVIHINPHLRYARMEKSWHSKNIPGRCYDCRLFYIERGSGSVTVGNRSYTLRDNTVVFFPSGTQYRFNLKKSENEKYYTINFDFTQQYSHLKDSLLIPDAPDFEQSKMLDTASAFGPSEIS